MSRLEESIRQLCAFISLETSTSYAEAKSLPIGEMIDLYNNVVFYLQEKYRRD